MNDYFKNKSFRVNEKNDPSQEDDIIQNDTEKYAGFGYSLKSKSKFYVNNDATSPINEDSESENETYRGFGFSKNKKVNNLNYVFDNPCLDLNILDDNSPISKKKKSETIDKCTTKVKPNKRKNEFTYENENESLENSSKFTFKKQKCEFSYENEGLDLEFSENLELPKEDTNESVLNKYESNVPCSKISNKTLLKKSKKKKESLANENHVLDVEFSDVVKPKQIKQNKSNLLSNGYDNLGLNLEFSDKSTPKKPKRNKNISLLDRNENHALNTESVGKPVLKESKENYNLELNVDVSNKSILKNTKKTDNDVLTAYENLGLDITSPNPIGSSNIETERDFEELSIIYENSEVNLDYPHKTSLKKDKTDQDIGILTTNEKKSTPMKMKKYKKKKILTTGIENPALDLEIIEIAKDRKYKEKEILSNAFDNPALDVNYPVNEICCTSDFEVSRISNGLENSALDLSDENLNKKRVTFNAQIEYSSDTPKKKKKRKKLDKYEVTNDNWKKRNNKTIESAAFINEAVDEEIINIEEIENEINERKSKKCKRKKERRIPLLETIDETPEEENLNETPIIVNDIFKEEDTKKIAFKDKITEITVEDDEIVHENLHKKKKKKNKNKNKNKSATEECFEINELEEINLTEEQIKKTNNSLDSIKNKTKKVIKTKLPESLNICNDVDHIVKENISSYSEEINLTEESNKIISNNEQLPKKIKKKKKRELKIEPMESLEISNEIDYLQKENVYSNNKGTNVTEESIKIMHDDNKLTKKISKKKKKDIQIEPMVSSEICSEIDNVQKEEISRTDCQIVKKVKKSSSKDIMDSEEFLNKNDETKSQLENQNEFHEKIETNTETNEIFNCNYNFKSRKLKHKEMIKSLFLKNPILMFPGSNINEIKGYGFS
jgi:hypothetical protein